MYVPEKYMDAWKEIAAGWCENNNARLLFVNSVSFGCEMPDGNRRHISIEELADILSIET